MMEKYDGWAFKYLSYRDPFFVSIVYHTKSAAIKAFERPRGKGSWKNRDRTWIDLVKIKLIEVA